LQDKISKTLVDALIDIQNEEAPLIQKFSSLGNRCGSCNQNIKDKNEDNQNIIISRMISPKSEYKENNNNSSVGIGGVMSTPLISGRHPLRGIHEIGSSMGNYSNILSKLNLENLDDINIDLRSRNNNYTNLVNLPEVLKKPIKLKSNEFKGGHLRNKSNINNEKFLKNGNMNLNLNPINNSMIYSRNSEGNFSDKLNAADDVAKFLVNDELDNSKRLKGENLLKVMDRVHKHQ
jgi:hypothetical protein